LKKHDLRKNVCKGQTLQLIAITPKMSFAALDLAPHALLPLAGELYASGVGVDDEEGGSSQPEVVLPHKFSNRSEK